MKTPEKLINEAVKEAKAGRYSAAERIYRKVINRDPENLDGHYLLGSLLAEKGDLKAAEKHLKMAVDISPNSPYIWNNLGNLQLLIGDLDSALSAWQKAIRYKPDLAEAWCNMGLVYQHHENFEEAESCMRNAVASKDLPAAWCVLANLAEKRGSNEEARLICQKVLEVEPDYHGALFMLSRLEGRPMPIPPQQGIRNLFDRYARSFDSHLKEGLGYSIPENISEIIKSHEPSRNFELAADLGCGTGLMGLQVKSEVKELVGVDLSSRMLALAKEKNIYDRLVESDLIEFLNSEERNFDLILAADVLVYMGELAPLFSAASEKATHGALFAFSTESSDGDEWELRNTGRYAHTDSFVHQSAESSGWKVISSQGVIGRKESGTPVKGNIYLLSRQ